MKNLFMILFVVTTGVLFAQTTTGSADTTTAKRNNQGPVLAYAEEMPQFPGEEGAFQKYLQENIVYPKSAVIAGKQGTVYVSFVVMNDGRIDSVKLERGIMNAPELGEEAIRVISAMPNWTPGKMNGKPVKIKMTVPIRFELQGNKKRRKKKNTDSGK